MRRDYYDVLGVQRGAGLGAIRKAFRARARRLHPDVSTEPDANDQFRELVEAYSVLSRAPSRLLYDRAGYRGRGHGGFTSRPPEEESTGEAEAREPDRVTRDAPEATYVVSEVRVSVVEAARGTTAVAPLAGTVVCSVCGGRGEASADPQPCPTCEGRGRVPRTARDDVARVVQVEPCPRCNGRGTSGPACSACDGSGLIELPRQVVFTVPGGVRNGDTIPVAGAEVVIRVVAPTGDGIVRAASAVGLAIALVLLLLVLVG